MRPAPFAYHAPATLAEAAALLAELGPQSRILAGGQSLVAAMNLRLARPAALVDLRRIAGLDVIRVEPGKVTIGARVTHAAIAASRELAASLPVLPQAAGHIAHQTVRNRGTFVGSIANADPASEWPAALLALGGRVRAESVRGTRWIGAEDLFVTYFTTALEPDEVLAEAELPIPAGDVRYGFREFARQPGAFALALAVARMILRPDGTIGELRIAIGGCAPTAVMPVRDWSFAAGRRPDAALSGEIAEAIAAAVEPHSDIHAAGEDRRQIVRTLVRRCLDDMAGAPAPRAAAN